jgi:hypothetical protein
MKEFLQTRFLGFLLVIGLSSCFSKGDLSKTKAVKPEVLEVSVTDWSGNQTPQTAIARRPLIELKMSTSIDDSIAPIMLLSGRPDEQLLEDLSTSPLRADNSELMISSEISYNENLVTLAPRGTLESGEIVTVIVAGWARTKNGTPFFEDESPFFVELTVSDDADAGARVEGSWPANGTSNVAPNLAFAAVHFDGEIKGYETGMRIEDTNGVAIAATITRETCDEIGWETGGCIVLTPHVPLAPSSRYQIVVDESVQDARGAPVGPWSSTFYTASQIDADSPTYILEPCAIDETEIKVGCALVDDQGAIIRFSVNEPVRIELLASNESTSLIAPRGDAAISVKNREPESVLDFQLTAIDAAGNRSITSFAITTETDLARLSITEVRADPRGQEPAQEFIELLNYGDTPTDLEGFSISDQRDDLGDIIKQSVRVNPGERVLLVADGFDPNDSKDDMPLPGTILVRLGSALTGSGLSNSGSDLFLRDPSGRRVSAAPADPRPQPGVCIVRVSDDMRDGSKESFAYDLQHRCTPGA